MLRTRAIAAAALTTLTLGVTACGGSDGLSKKELNAKAGTICKDVAKKAANVKQPTGTDVAALSDYFEKVAPITEELASRLKDLKPADDVKDDWNALTSALQKSSDAFKSVAEKTKSKDQAGIQKAGSELSTLSSQTDAAAKKLGLTDCNNT